jgi:LacI family transcriptional regulator
MKKKEPPLFGVKEIARRAQVSIGTVDRVIHNRSGVSEKTREKINGIIKELNYQPNILASRLASKKVYRIAVLIPKISEETDFWEAPLKGIQRAGSEVRKYGISIDLFFFDLKDKSSFIKQAKAVLKKKPDGVLLSPLFNQEAAGFAQSCLEDHLPVVVIDTPLPHQQGLCYIGPDMFHSAYQAAQLIDFGTPQGGAILFLNISEAQLEPQVEKGFDRYFRDNRKRTTIVKLNIDQTDFRSVQKQLTSTFTKHQEISSIFVTNSRVSAVAAYLEKRGMENIFLIGYDILKENLQYLEKGIIDFLISHKPEEQGYRAIMAIYQTLVTGSEGEGITLMPIDIITRYNYKFYSS